MRGRPRTIIGERRYPNRLRELRDRLGVSQEKIAEQAAISIAYYGALERGGKRINADTAQRLHLPLRCAVGDLLPGAQGVSLPLRIAIAAAESEGRPELHDLALPYEWLQPRRLADPENCFAAEIFDDSADLDFPNGTILCARELAHLREPLRLGMKLIVRFLLDAGETPRTHEILYGILDQNILGDFVLITRTRNRLIPRSALIQAGTQQRSGLGERHLAMAPRDGLVDYRARSDDPAQILGVVVYSMAPE